MPIPVERLAGSLSKQLAAVYLVAGDEPLLVQEACDAIRAAARESGCAEREVLHVEGGFDWQQLASAGASMSLFSERRLLELHLDAGAGREGGAAIRDYCAQPPDDTVLVIRAGAMDRRARETAWVKAIEKAGAFVYGWSVAPDALPGWVQQRMTAAGLPSGIAGNAELAALIAHRNEGNLLGCAQEIDKLALLLGDEAEALTDEQLAGAINDGARFGSFDLVDKLLRSDLHGALRSLYRLREEGEQPLALLGALSWSVRGLARIAAAEGRGSDGLYRELKLFGDRRSSYQQSARRLGREHLERALQRIAAADRAAKGASKLDPWGELVELVLILAPSRQAMHA